MSKYNHTHNLLPQFEEYYAQFFLMYFLAEQMIYMEH